MRAVALLSIWKIKNSLRSLFSDPRKLIPVVLALVFLAFPISAAMFSRSILNSSFSQFSANQQKINQRLRAQGSPAAQAGNSSSRYKVTDRRVLPTSFASFRSKIDPDIFAAAISLTMILLGIGLIGTGLGERLLALGAADVDYLFPAPISRRVVLAYRLPGLTLTSVGIAIYLLFFIAMITMLSGEAIPGSGNTVSPWWFNPGALFLSGGIYLNLAMFIAIQFPKRQAYLKLFWFASAAFICSLGAVFTLKGIEGIEELLRSPALHWGFLPSSLASDTLVATYTQHPASAYISWLIVGYLGSIVIMMSSNANWYEQSIISTEKMTALRQAAKGGFAGVMAAKAATYKYKGVRSYTVAPFGQGAVALFWAHLCAATKKPIPNFFIPLGAGILMAVAARYVLHSIDAEMTVTNHGRRPGIMTQSIGFVIVGFLAFYSWQIFTTTSRTASEASIRRRELVAPLPIPGWQSVAADLGVPFCAILLCYEGFALTYIALQGSNWPIIAFAFAFVLPLRLGSRIILQYIVVIAYPDLADKIQRLVSLFINSIVGIPFTFIEAIVCIPGLILRSPWLALIPLALVQIPLGALFLFLAGKASEKAIATGEPVRILSLLRGKP